MASDIQILGRRYPEKRAFITGAASGLGAELARQLAGEGWQLGLNDIDAAALDKVVKECNQGGSRVNAYAFDVCDQAAFFNAASRFIETAGGADLLIQCAGIGAGGLFTDLSPVHEREVMEVNYHACMTGCRAFLPHFLEQGSGHIINVASAAAFHGMPHLSAYNASKAALLAASETLSAELRGSGVYVSLMMCTFYRSDIWKHTRGEDAERDAARRLGESARLTIARAANLTLKGVAGRKFYIVFPALARSLWLFKRLYPHGYLRLVPRLFDAVVKPRAYDPE